MKKNIQQLKSYKILLIGDSCQDTYAYGVIDRHCFEERPVKKNGTPVLKIDKIIEKSGMARNVFENLLALGQDIDFITNKELITKLRLIHKKSNSEHSQILRVDYGDTVDEIDLCLLREIDLGIYDCIAISDYNKGFVTESLVEYIVKNYSGLVFADSKKTDLSKFENCIIKINDHEHERVVALPKNHELIITLGKKGAKWRDSYFKAVDCKNIIDICGAGDTFFSSLIVAYLSTHSFKKSILIANHCASYVLQHTGNHHIEREKLEKLICKY